MRFERKIGINLLLVVLILLGANLAFAEKTLRLVIEQNTPNPRIPVASVCSSIPSNFVIKKVGDELNFTDQKNKLNIKNGLLPSFNLKEVYAEGGLPNHFNGQ